MTDWLTAVEWRAVALSLRVWLWAALVGLPFGVFVAYALARWSFRGKALLNGIVHLPLILPGIVAGAILAFAKAMGDFGATITFVSNIPGQTQTIPSAIYSFLQVPGGGASAMRLVAVSAAIAMAALLVSEWLSKRIARTIGRA